MMPGRNNVNHRRSIRLRDYDHTQNGAYFVTICTLQGVCLFGDVVDGEMVLNDYGAIVWEEWQRTAIVRANIELDAFVVMPNHVHGIIVIVDNDSTVGATRRVAPTNTRPTGPKAGSLGAIVGQFKSVATKRIRQLSHVNVDIPIWQRNYYEHIIRNEKSFNDIRAYIANNPAKWAEDSFYTQSGFPHDKIKL